jgi:hypothetical protein
MDDAHQIKTMTENFPFRWRNGQRDSITSLCVVMQAAREHELYRKCGCATWEEYCQKYYNDTAAGFDELIEGVRILDRQKWRGPISEADARNAVAQARQEAKEHATTEKGGRPKGNRNTTVLSDGRGASYRLRRLARLKPDVLDAYERGEFPSVDAAFRHAFALDTLRATWKRASDTDRETFLREIAS